MLNEKDLEKLRLKMNSKEKTEERNKLISDSLKNIEAEVDKALADTEMPSDAELAARMKALLFDVYKSNEQASTETKEAPDGKIKNIVLRKRLGRAILLAAVISLLGLSFIVTSVASKHNISIENGIVEYVKGAVSITIFGEKEGEYISVEKLKVYLENNGLGDIPVPKYFDGFGWKVTPPEHIKNEITDMYTFKIYDKEEMFSFSISPLPQKAENKPGYYLNLEGAETIKAGEMYVYLFEHNKGKDCAITYYYSDYCIRIISETDFSTIKGVAETIK